MAVTIASIKMKVIPKEWEGNYFFLPVDIAAETFTKMLFHDKAQSGLYNLLKPEGIGRDSMRELYKEFGVAYKEVTYKEFGDLAKENVLLAPFLEVYESEESMAKMWNSSPALQLVHSKESAKPIYRSDKINKLIPEFEKLVLSPKDILRKHLKYGEKEGLGTKLGITK
jgi:hypothetical protein